MGLPLIAAAVLMACGGGGDSAKTITGAATYAGVAMAGNVSGATVEIYALNADGTLGSKVGTGTTQSDGSFSIATTATSASVVIKVNGGTYTSEADTSKTVAGGEFLSASFSSTGETGLAVTPLTSMATAYAMKAAGTSGNVATSFNEAQTKLIKAYFDIDTSTLKPIQKIIPSFTTVDGPEGRAGLALAFFEQLAQNISVTPSDLYAALAADSADGQLDGKGAGGTQVKVGTTNAAATLFTSDLLSAINAYQLNVKSVHSNNNVNLKTGKGLIAITQSRTAVTTAASTFFAGTGIDVGSAGSVTQLSFAGSGGAQKQFIFVAARADGILGIDISDPATPITTKLTTLNAALAKQSFATVGGVIAVPGAVTPQVIVFNYGSRTIHLVDVVGEKILASKTITVNASANFSGAGAYIAGGIADTKRNLIWLATADGYLALDPNTLEQVGTTIELANEDPISENMGGDPSADMLLSPNYGSSSEAGGTRYWGLGGIQWVDLQSNIAYSMRPTDYQTLTGQRSLTCTNTITSLCAPVMDQPDQGAVDSVYKVGLIANEDSYGVVGAMKLDKTAYTFDSANKFFVAKTPATTFKTMNLSGSAPLGRLSGVVVESGNHYALLMSGNGSRIGVAKIDNPNAPANGSTWSGFSDWRTYTASLAEFGSVGDPHAAGAIKSVNTGRSYGFLLSASGSVAMIDLEGFINATSKSANSSDRTLASTPFNNTIIRTLVP